MKRWMLGLMTAALMTAGGTLGLAVAPAGAAPSQPVLSAPVAAVASTPVQPLDRDGWRHHGRHGHHHHRRGDDGRHGDHGHRCVGLIVLGCR